MNLSKFQSVDELIKYAGRIFGLQAYYNKFQKNFEKKNISIDDLVKIFGSDPTVSEITDYKFEEGYFTAWLNKELKTNYEKLLSDAEHNVLKKTLSAYMRYKDEYNFNPIGDYDITSLESEILQKIDTSSAAYKLSLEEPEYETVFSNEELEIFRALNWKAAIYFGDIAYNGDYPKNRWCVTWNTDQGEYYYDGYKARGGSEFIHDRRSNEWYAYFGNEFQDIDNDRSASQLDFLYSFETQDVKKALVGIFPEILNKVLRPHWDLTPPERNNMVNTLTELSDFGARPDENTLDTAINTHLRDATEFVISLGAKPGPHSLTNALKTKDWDIVNHVESLGAQSDKETLQAAIETKNFYFVEMALKHGAYLTRYTLHAAVETGNVELVKQMIQSNIFFDAPYDPYEESIQPLEEYIEKNLVSCAARSNNPEMVRAVINGLFGLKVVSDNIFKPYNGTERISTLNAAINSVSRQFNTEIIDLVIEAGAEPNEYTVETAILSGSTGILKKILDIGAEASMENVDQALDNHRPDMAKIIEDHIWSRIDSSSVEKAPEEQEEEEEIEKVSFTSVNSIDELLILYNKY